MMETRAVILALVAFLAFFGSSAALPGVRSLMLMPASVYVNGTQDAWVNINFNLTYYAWDGINLSNFSVTFENNQSIWTTTNCTNKALLPAGWNTTFSTDNTTRWFANQTCSFQIGKDTPVGLWELANITLLSARNESFQPFGIPLMSIINVEMGSPLCLPPTIYVTRTAPANRVKLTSFPEQPALTVLDDSDETQNFTIGVYAPNGVNVSLSQFSFRQRGILNGTVLQTIPCGLPSDPLVTNGTITCGMYITNGTLEYVYELFQLKLVDAKGNEWNSDKLDLIRAINADLNDEHLSHHVNPEHGSVYHSHLCALPIMTVVNELNSCNPARFVRCLMQPMECDNTTNPRCPDDSNCRLRYRFARCAVQYNCYDALSVWCGGGFFNQSGCGAGAANAPIWTMCAKAKLSNCRPDDLAECTSTRISPANATSCQHRQAFNQCVHTSHCAALLRDVAECNKSNDFPGPPVGALLDEVTAAYYLSLSHPAHAGELFQKLGPRMDEYARRTSLTTFVAIFIAAAVVVVVGVAVVVRRRRGVAVAVAMEQELL